MSQYPNVQLLINGQWVNSLSGKSLPVVNPASNEKIGTVAFAEKEDLDLALAAADKGFQVWRKTPAMERSKLMRKAADILRSRADDIAKLMSLEQGKPVAEAKVEVLNGADIIDWFAEEARRTYGRVIPARTAGITNMVVKDPVGPVAAFTPWNFPINQIVRKLSAAVATGCSIIVKAPEETPASPAELLRAFVDAGVPEGVVGLVYGNPADISNYLIAHPVIRKITFTGSTPVGKLLAGLAGQHMKRATMELGGHSPTVVFNDADVNKAVSMIAAMKFRNAGQVCIAPTRILVQSGIYNDFVEAFTAKAKKIKVGDGADVSTQMGGPLANIRRAPAIEKMVADAVSKGAEIRTGGGKPEGVNPNGFFYAPTVLTNCTTDMQLFNDEPFGPVAPIMKFEAMDDLLRETNRLPYGLASYAFTRSIENATTLQQNIEAGMLWINAPGNSFTELPFGGLKDSGYGSEGGSEAVEAYLNTRLIVTGF